VAQVLVHHRPGFELERQGAGQGSDQVRVAAGDTDLADPDAEASANGGQLAARAAGARLLLPGTVYDFGPDTFDDPIETAPQNPLTRKGAIPGRGSGAFPGGWRRCSRRWCRCFAS